MAMVASDTRTSLDTALDWARSAFRFAGTTTVTNHPWATTIRLDGPDGAAFLKILPVDGPRRVQLQARLAARFPERTPHLLAADAKNGCLLYDDHGGAALESDPDHETRLQLITSYAEIQRDAAASTSFLNDLPVRPATGQLDRLLAFLSGGDVSGGRTGAGNFIGSGSAGRYFEIVSASAKVLREFLADADQLAPTINHCDLRPANVARRPNGELVIYDWDDAVLGPPGLSLHNFFRGCFRPWQVLTGQPDAHDATAGDDRELLESYTRTLCEADAWEPAELQNSLPAAICAGAINYIVGFGEFATESERLRKTIGRNMRRRMSSLMDLAGMLVRDRPEDRDALAQAFIKAGRRERADALTGSKRTTTIKDRAGGVVTLRDSGEFPAITVTGQERRRGELAPGNRDGGINLFDKYGALLIRDALPVAAVKRCRDAFFQRYDRYLRDAKHDDALKVGNKRYMITVELSPPFSDADILTSPTFMPIVREFLGADMILGSLTCVASLPGSKDQSLHKDHKALFRERPNLQTPSFAISVVVPLIGLDATTGGTRVLGGSHRMTSEEAKGMPGQTANMALGSCFLMDYRLSHHGMANRSNKIRPILCFIFHRPWFRDYVNFGKQDPLIVPAGARDGMSKEARRLTDWASRE